MSVPLLPQINSLVIRFLERTVLDIESVRFLLRQAHNEANRVSTLARIARLAHSIHGTGASLGYSGVSDSAGALERRVKEHLAIRDPAHPPLDDLHELLWQLDVIVTDILTRLKTTGSGAAPT